MKTKVFMGLALLFISSVSMAQNALQSADTVLNNAYAQAAKENKKVILILHASWCGWCKKMEASLNDPTCKKMFDDNYVIAYLDVLENPGKENLQNPGATEVLKKYNAATAGLPFWLILDAKGNTLADSEMKPAGATAAKPEDNVGCPTEDNEVIYFTKVLKATSNLTDSDLATIQKRFLLNKPAPQKQTKASSK
jgi:thiol-disulfide isomerase/thioredoxin